MDTRLSQPGRLGFHLFAADRGGLGNLAVGGLLAQSAAVPLSFEVASIKPSAPDARGKSLTLLPRNGMRVSNAPLRMLIAFAYTIRDFQVSGGPAWIGTERYDILAKAERSAGSEKVPDDPRKMTDEQRMKTQEDMRERVRALLAKRFHLLRPQADGQRSKAFRKIRAWRTRWPAPGHRSNSFRLFGLGAVLQTCSVACYGFPFSLLRFSGHSADLACRR